MHKPLGIIGGMGPLASALFLRKVVETFPARKDQEHPRILLDSNPLIPDRTEAILRNGPSPAPMIIETGKNLIRAGARFLAMPCVTAHAFYDEIQATLDVPLLHMLKETQSLAKRCRPGCLPGILCTDGALKSGLFQKLFGSIVVPDETMQREYVMRSIACVKGGDIESSRPLIRKAAQQLIDRGATILIAGCTEIPLIFRPGEVNIPLLDPMDALARACLREWGLSPHLSVA